MKRTIFIYGGGIGAVIVGAIMVSLSLPDGTDSMNIRAWLGYLIMIVALSVVFIAIKRYRDRELGGVIRFGTAFLLGLGIVSVASVVYVGVWEVNLALTDYAFIDDYTQGIIDAKKSDGVSGEALDEVLASMEKLKAQYANPVYRMLITLLEIFPVGLLVALVSAAILRNRRGVEVTA